MMDPCLGLLGGVVCVPPLRGPVAGGSLRGGRLRLVLAPEWHVLDVSSSIELDALTKLDPLDKRALSLPSSLVSLFFSPR